MIFFASSFDSSWLSFECCGVSGGHYILKCGIQGLRQHARCHCLFIRSSQKLPVCVPVLSITAPLIAVTNTSNEATAPGAPGSVSVASVVPPSKLAGIEALAPPGRVAFFELTQRTPRPRFSERKLLARSRSQGLHRMLLLRCRFLFPDCRHN